MSPCLSDFQNTSASRTIKIYRLFLSLSICLPPACMFGPLYASEPAYLSLWCLPACLAGKSICMLLAVFMTTCVHIPKCLQISLLTYLPFGMFVWLICPAACLPMYLSIAYVLLSNDSSSVRQCVKFPVTSLFFKICLPIL